MLAQQQHHHNQPMLQHAVVDVQHKVAAASLASGVATLAMSPLDVVKVSPLDVVKVCVVQRVIVVWHA